MSAKQTPSREYPIEPSLVQRLTSGLRYALTGRAPEEWFGPSEPMAPQAPPEVAGRQFDYAAGYNTRTTPRSGEAVSFEQLRALADAYDLMRLVIETRKDQLSGLKWSVKPRDPKAKPDRRCAEIEQFLRRPDGVLNWSQWLRALVEDLLVIDAPTIYPRRTVGGEPWALELMDGATIKRVIGADGRTPREGAAYQQVLKGVPAVDYELGELIYRPRNVRTHRVYGMSPVEQVMMTVNIALRRQVHQLQYYTEGNIPEALLSVPEKWTTEQIKQFQDYWDELFEGSTAKRRHAKFVPGGMAYVPTKDTPLKDTFDEWLARVICFAFSISPGAMLAMMNKATAQVADDSAIREGLLPLMTWVEETLDDVIASFFGAPDLSFVWQVDRRIDPLKQAQIHEIYSRISALTPDEIRHDLGRDPLTDEQREQIKAARPQPPAMFGAGAGGEEHGGEQPEGKGRPQAEGNVDDREADKAKGVTVENHIHLAPPDVVVDVGATVIKMADGQTVEVQRQGPLTWDYK